MDGRAPDADRRDAARSSLIGLAVGDALGSQFFVPANRQALTDRTPPPAPWQWTDDTEMACGVFTVLADNGSIDQDMLAGRFAEHHDFDRGYGPATNRMLRLIRQGGSWRELAEGQFDGRGSWGNGAAMRVAPLGAWYADDIDRAAEQAALSATVTHTHPEAVSGAIAVACATAYAASTEERIPPGRLLDTVTSHVPDGPVRSGLSRARELLTIGDPTTAAAVLGNGRKVSAQDTVPFALWAAARNLDDYERAFWATAQVGGDIDTTCAIVGGIVAAHLGADHLPPAWRNACEPLPSWSGVRTE